MFDRKIYSKMLDWKESGLCKKKALVIKGLRQSGKTYIVRYFANNNYENVVYIDFKLTPSMKIAFEGDLDVNRLTVNLSAGIPSARFIPGKTVIIFDEIQECSGARSSIKAFVSDGRYDIICTGSLLGIRGYNRKAGNGTPVGYEHILTMTPMDFEEFLWAKGTDRSVIQYLRDCMEKEEAISESVHESMLRYFKEYICVGGLPSVVDTFVTTNDMNAVYESQHDLIETYMDDFGKHLDDKESEITDSVLLAKIKSVFESVPLQLSKENKKFQFSGIRKGGRSSEYITAIQWLCDYGMVGLCRNLSLLQTPLEGNVQENVFKIYMQDSGLFISMLDKGTAKDVLTGNLSIYKGAIFENIVADAFLKMGRALYYYHRDNGTEIDFVMRYKGELCLIEVKSTTGNAKSAKMVLAHPEIYGIRECIKLGEYNIGRNGGILTLPYYLTFMLTE